MRALLMAWAGGRLLAGLCAAVLVACAQPPAPAPSSQAPAPVAAPVPAPPLGPPAPWVPNDQPQGSGAFPALMEVPPGLPTHTLYRPASLAGLGNARMPIVVWANGACVNVGNRFRPFLTEIASHGYLVLAIGPIGPREVEQLSSGNASRGAPAAKSPTALAMAQGWKPPEGPGSNRPSDTTPEQMRDAITWAIAENSRAGGPLQGRIDTSAVAAMGQSCGGLQAIDTARDARVKTLGVWNSGLFNDDTRPYAIAAAAVVKATLKTLHTPAIYVTGEPSEVAFKNADDDVARIDGVPVFRAWLEGTGHSGTYRERNGGAYAAVAVAWLNWQLKGDAVAARQFKGDVCGLCKAPGWHVSKKRIDD